MRRNRVVVDTSIAIKWAINEHDSSTALALLTEWTDTEVVILAPALLAYEATNTLYRHVRRGLIPLEDAERALQEVILATVELEFEEAPDLHIRAMQLAYQFGLPAAYDAHYLALAEREGCELWTADERLWNTIRGRLAWVRWMTDSVTP
jgi:predicted nucleic acid-binding protein